MNVTVPILAALAAAMSFARRAAHQRSSPSQSVVDRSATPAFDVFLDECISLAACRRVNLAGPWFMARATRKLSCPLAQSSLDVSKCPVPIHSSGSRSRIAVVDPLLVAKGSQRFDVAVVKEPATRDHMMIEMREPRHGTELCAVLPQGGLNVGLAGT